jgi:hypothetical protein
MSWLCFEDIDRKEYGLLKTKRKDFFFLFFLSLLNLFLTPLLLVSHYFIIFIYPCTRDTITSCLCRCFFTDKGLLTCFKTFLYKDSEFKSEKKSLGNIESKKELKWKRVSELTYEGKNQMKLKINKLFENGM